MTLGERISALRTARGLSQSELAEALEVSRQSVSKWETDASVPDLDRLVKLAELFGVSLDQLVRGEAPPSGEGGSPEPGAEPASASPPPPPRGSTPLTVRTAAGLLLLFLGALVWLLCALFAASAMGGVILAAPFLLCGAICLILRRHAALVCGWAVWLIFALPAPYFTSVRWWAAFLPGAYRGGITVQLILSWIMAAALAALAAGTAWQVRKGRANRGQK